MGGQTAASAKLLALAAVGSPNNDARFTDCRNERISMHCRIAEVGYSSASLSWQHRQCILLKAVCFPSAELVAVMEGKEGCVEGGLVESLRQHRERQQQWHPACSYHFYLQVAWHST